MNLLSSKKNKFIIITVYFAVVALIVSFFCYFSYALYRQRINAYTKFEIANFNAGILGNQVANADPLQPIQFKAFDDIDLMTCDIYNAKPGLVDENGLFYPFKISNGIPSDFAQIDISYEIRLRTTDILPFEYTLILESTDGDVTLVTGEPTEIQVTEGDGTVVKLNEYCFYETADSTTEKLFSISCEDGFAFNSHKLLIEWPVSKEVTTVNGDGVEETVTEQQNITKYMSEIEAFQIYVTVYSDNYGENVGEVIINPDAESVGVVILGQQKDASGKVVNCLYLYSVSYNSFCQKEVDNLDIFVYNFIVDNGVNLGKKQDKIYVFYTLKMRVPYSTDNDKLKYALSVQDSYDLNDNGNTTEFVEYSSTKKYVWCCNAYGTPDYGTETQLNAKQFSDYKAYLKSVKDKTEYKPKCEGEEFIDFERSDYTVYEEYTFAWNEQCTKGKTVATNDSWSESSSEAVNFLINYTQGLDPKEQYSKNTFQLVISGIDDDGEAVSLTQEDIDKLEKNLVFTVDARYSDLINGGNPVPVE